MARDIRDLIVLLNLIQGLRSLVGEDEFKKRYPEFIVAADKVRARIRSEIIKGG